MHDPFGSCLPSVRLTLEKLAQKLMKLFVDVSDATCPGVGVDWPSWANAWQTTLESSAIR